MKKKNTFKSLRKKKTVPNCTKLAAARIRRAEKASCARTDDGYKVDYLSISSVGPNPLAGLTQTRPTVPTARPRPPQISTPTARATCTREKKKTNQTHPSSPLRPRVCVRPRPRATRRAGLVNPIDRSRRRRHRRDHAARWWGGGPVGDGGGAGAAVRRVQAAAGGEERRAPRRRRWRRCPRWRRGGGGGGGGGRRRRRREGEEVRGVHEAEGRAAAGTGRVARAHGAQGGRGQGALGAARASRRRLCHRHRHGDGRRRRRRGRSPRAGKDGEKRRRSDVAAPASRISGKKHARTRSFSSTATKSSLPDAGARRALSQEPPPPPTSERPTTAGAGSHRVARVTGGGATTTAPKPRVFSGHRSSTAKEHGSSSAKGGTTKPKPPRSLPRRSSSGGLENLKEAVLSNTCAAVAPAQSCSTEQATVHGETGNASPPSPFAGAAAANARAASPDSDCGEAVDGGSYDREAEAKRVGEHDAEEVTVSPQKLANGEITSDSDTEPSYVYVKKDDVEGEEDAMARRSEALAETTAPPSDAVAAESATTIVAEEAPARESSDESSSSSSSSFSGIRSGRGSPPSSAPASYISRAPSIERLLEEDAALLRKKRQQSADKLALMAMTTTTMSTPPARVSGAARSRGFKSFLSFGKKNRRGKDVTVIDCTSPSVPSVADDDSGSGGWPSGETIKPRMASSDAASDDMDHGYAIAASPQGCSLQSLVVASPAKSELHEIDPQEKSPKAHRSFFSFRSFNCGRS
ncbi:Os02g0781900 [Oryza sativa Japonica Group]|uniref:Os02g0781900 protein n=1 Tax=Oryza sativa subsp. japonica TaxID=39947 RepID=A0A0P0VQD1_ORYSJ|nr:hypothetical protein EE612_014066 [Oryza sativa]BAS81229.1 Os02g0781900 [Oryza sativa Japonica Group]